MTTVFHIQVHPRGAGCEVTVAGELDIATAPQLRAALTRPLTTHRHVRVDLSGLTFCDCAGLSALLAAAHTARRHGTELHLHALPLRLARLLNTTHTRSVFVIDPP